MTTVSVLRLVFVCMALCTLAVESLVFEQFLANMCTSSADDVVLTDKSFYDCFKQCEARSDCTAVSYMQKTALCRMDFQRITPGKCQGYIYIQKADGKQTSSYPCYCSKRDKRGEDDCDKLHVPDNGKIFGTRFGIGDKVSYRCDFGYDLNGTRNRVCKANGSWSGQDGKCVKECDHLHVPEHGQIVGVGFGIGDQISYRCNFGYVLNGTRNRVCQTNGSWSGQNVECLKECYTGAVKLYTGTWSTTVSGRRCQRWDSQYPHSQNQHIHLLWTGETVSQANNYCRDPDNAGFLWCYTTDPDRRWEECGIPLCT